MLSLSLPLLLNLHLQALHSRSTEEPRRLDATLLKALCICTHVEVRGGIDIRQSRGQSLGVIEGLSCVIGLLGRGR